MPNTVLEERVEIVEGSEEFKLFERLLKKMENRPHGLTIHLPGYPTLRLFNDEDLHAMKDLLSDLKDEYAANKAQLDAGQFSVFDRAAFERKFKSK